MDPPADWDRNETLTPEGQRPPHSACGSAKQRTSCPAKVLPRPYAFRRSPINALPIPSLLDIADAVEQRDDFVLVVPRGEIVAVAGIFRILAHSTGDFFRNLSGMATHPSVGDWPPLT